ncbi:MAG: hypothetical protein GY757_50830, partial [bacterium]|nr:hypothetical protein [bacterium]
PQGVELFKKNENPNALESVENYYRIVYFPVWEVGYSYKGILFKSHVSAVDGKIIKIQGLRCHKKKMLKAMGGLLALGILLGRGINGGAAPLFIALLIGLPAAIILTPYFWELFAFQEIAEKRGEGEFLFKAINYTENSFIQFSRKIMSTFENLVGEARDDEPFD